MKTNKQGGTGTLITIAWRNIWRNTRRTALCAAAVGIAVFFAIFMQSWMDGMVKSMHRVVQAFDTGHVNIASREFEEEKEYYPVQYPVSGGRDSRELAAVLGAIPGVRAVLPRITAYATLRDSTVKHALLWGVDIEAELAAHPFNLTHNTDGIIEGRYPAPDSRECAIGAVLARKMGLGIGDEIPMKTVSAQFSDKIWSPVISGIFNFDYRKYDEDVIIVPIDRLQRLLVLNGGAQQLYLYGENANASRVIAARARELLGADTVVREWTDNYFVAMMRQSMVSLIVIYLVFQIVASFLIINTVLMIIHERIKEIGMMGALGMTRAEIVKVFFFEAVFLSVLGAFAGGALGALASFTGSRFPFDFTMFTGGGMKDFPISGTLYLDFSLITIARGFLFGVVIASVCTLIPSLKSAFVQPVEALRG